MDKSFLQAVSGEQLRAYVRQGWVFGIVDAFWHEHFRKWDRWRLANIRKLKAIEEMLVLLPGIGEMLRAEAEYLKPASRVLKGKRVTINPKVVSVGGFFQLDSQTVKTAQERTVELEERLDILIDVWRDFKRIPAFSDAKQDEIPQVVRELALQIRDDRDDIRGFYNNHRAPNFPAAELIDEEWTFFRSMQVRLLAGLEFFASYGVAMPFSREKLLHELIDIDYLIPAIIVGGLACREKRIIDRFELLCPDGVVLR